MKLQNQKGHCIGELEKLWTFFYERDHFKLFLLWKNDLHSHSEGIIQNVLGQLQYDLHNR